MIKCMNFIKVLKDVFSKKKYIFMAVIITFLFYSLNIVLSSWEVFSEFSSDKSFFGTIKLFFFLFFKIGGINNVSSSISLILISILLGILFSLILYKTKIRISSDKKAHFFGGVGIFLTVFVPGCAACGVGLFSVLGLSVGILYSLPFKGLGLSVLSILILSFTIYKITKDMYVCKISNSFSENKNRFERR